MKGRLVLIKALVIVLCSYNFCCSQTNEIGTKEYHSLFVEYHSQVKSGNYSIALETLQKLEQIALTLNSEELLKIYYARIYCEHTLGSYLESINYCNKYLSLISSDKPSNKEVAGVHVYLGNNYYSLDELSLSLDQHFMASALYKEKDNQKGVGICNANIASVYEKLGSYYEAIDYIKKNLKYFKKNQEDIGGIIKAYKQMARNHKNLAEIDVAISYLDSALNLALEHKSVDFIPDIYRTYARIYRVVGDKNKELYYFNLAYTKAFELNNYFVQGSVCNSLVWFYLNEQNYKMAIQIGEEFLKQSGNTKQIKALDISEQLYEAYVESKQYQKAVEIQAKYKPLADSVAKINKNNKIRQAEIRSLAEKREVENKLLIQQDVANKQTIKVQNLYLILIFIILILVIAIAVIIFRASQINKRLSNKNKLQSENLIQLDQAKSRFFANISHDLRTPLTLIMGGLQHVLDTKDNYLTTKSEKQLKTSLKNGERIIHLTNEINELIKLEDDKLKIEKKFINIDNMLNLFTQMFTSLTSIKGVNLSYSRSIFNEKPIVSIDPNQFEKVLFNLITNAIKHTKDGDSITISLNASTNGKALLISIIDSGEGIPEQQVPFIFDRYYQATNSTHKTQEGFGIGLALVKEIINKHDAKITVKSSHGKGSEFTIKLPIQHEDDAALSEYSELHYSVEKRELFKDVEEIDKNTPVVNINSKTNKNALKKEVILIVEDHPEIRDYIKDILEDSYQILTASNGKRALKVLDKEHVDLIITDLMMPWFDGFELLESLKSDEKLTNIPALVLSARSSEEDRDKVLSIGVNDFLTKPFNAKELILRIENLIKKTKNWNNNSSEALFINNQKTLDEIEKSLLKKVEKLILDKIDDPNLSVGYLADQIAVSERKFYRMIKKLTNGTPFEFIKEVRLQYAHDILKKKKINTASEVAKFIGMNNVSHFNKQFKSRFGKAPSDMI